jgi:hypothetical protein
MALKDIDQLFGEKCFDSFAKLNHDGLWLKTFRDFSQVMMDGSLETFLGTWPGAGMMRNGICYPQQGWERRIYAEGFLFLPTPDCSDRRSMKSKQQGLSNYVKRWPTPRANKIGGQSSLGFSPTLEQAVRYPTPRSTRGGSATETVKMFATPKARDYRTGQHERWITKNHGDNLNDQIGGQLNPMWVEWLMGFPLGWTVLDVSETPSSRKSRKKSAK